MTISLQVMLVSLGNARANIKRPARRCTLSVSLPLSASSKNWNTGSPSVEIIAGAERIDGPKQLKRVLYFMIIHGDSADSIPLYK